MARTNRDLFVEENVPALRFEDQDDYQRMHARAGNHAHDMGHPAAAAVMDDDPFSELKQKQESLLRIRQELERTQREAQELEARRNKEERFVMGRREICEKLARSLSKLEKDLYQSQKAIEEISLAREGFQRHLEVLRQIHPEEWKRHRVDEELDRAIGVVEDAEDDFNKSMRRLSSVASNREEGSFGPVGGGQGLGLPQGFSQWVTMGLAFTLPLMVAGMFVGGMLVLVLMKYLR